MEVLHISPIYNRKSILKNGIIPSPVKLTTHLKMFKEDKVCTDDDKAIYTWESCDKNKKFVKDMIYCIAFIHPRNEIFEKNDENINYKKILYKNLYKYDQMIFDIYKIEVPDKRHYGIHLQEPSDSKYCTSYNMDDQYAHRDKFLHIYKEPLKNLEIIGKANYYYDNKKYNINL